MNINEVKGAYFKKALSASRCYFRWHNKNTKGGNFGFEMRGLIGGRELELWGHYDANGEIYHLAIGEVFGKLNALSKEIYSNRDSLISLISSICGDVKEN